MSAQPPLSPQTARILRRTDFYLLPFLSILFLLNSLDRSNIGNAESAGFTRYAGLQPSDLNDAVAAFFFAFVALQPVGAALGKRVGAGRWVGSVMVGWGVLTCATAWVSTRGGLIALRVAIGALEAGFYPTTVFYLSLFYTRYEFARRLGWFFGQYAVAGAFGGIVSYIVIGLFPESASSSTPADASDDTPTQGWHSYQILFMLEGILTIAVAITTFFWLPVGPGTAWWLTPAEAAIAERRVIRDRFPTASIDEQCEEDETELTDGADLETTGALSSSRRTKYHHRSSSSTDSNSSTESYVDPLLPKSGSFSTSTTTPTVGGEAALSSRDVFEAITDIKVWILLALNIAFSVPATAFSIFLPLILSSLSASPLTSNILTVPPFLLGAISLWIISHYSDMTGRRMPFILLGLCVNLTGLLIFISLPTLAHTAKYFALCLILSGSFVASPLTVAWLSNNVEQPGKRAVVLGINGWGNLAGVVSGWIFRPEYKESAYEWPMQVTCLLVAGATVGYAGFWYGLVRENGRRRRVVARWSADERIAEEVHGMGPEERGWVWRMAERWVAGGAAATGGEGKEKMKKEWRGRRGDERLVFQYGL